MVIFEIESVLFECPWQIAQDINSTGSNIVVLNDVFIFRVSNESCIIVTQKKMY